MAHKVCLIRGDGTGPELVAAVEHVIKAAKVDIEWIEVEAGLKCVEAGKPIVPDATIQKIKEVGVGLKAPMTTPIGKGSVSPNVTLRKRLDLYACVRPVRTLPGVPTPFDGLDIVIFRENTEDLYAQIEYMATERVAHSVKMISDFGCQRIIRAAFEYARKNGRKKVVGVHKANIMKIADGLFLRIFKEIAAEYPEIESWDNIIDNQCMQLVTKWKLYDVLVTLNLYGDIMSDLAAGMMGGLGVAPGANFGDKCALFEAVHGSAPKYTGMNKVNPTALLLSATLMLEHLGEKKARDDIEGALIATLKKGVKTYDLGGSATTSGFGEAIASELKA
ncbi:MAG: isocitrate/isopropylmalate dehydrogenase family protein [Fimbriimonas ginsengisoli]|uniref:Isocitrate/isopropylmalate dehydrogenase family protein n=1 Tax=Fimbriimonas ginsengisoli TaxID=1005039 RepID=A0A931LUJ9_FIMGI|nr:isocitrate/isopropylmalate dehydrogenase family protein [Fimbriimonas ginsengisoli]